MKKPINNLRPPPPCRCGHKALQHLDEGSHRCAKAGCSGDAWSPVDLRDRVPGYGWYVLETPVCEFRQPANGPLPERISVPLSFIGLPFRFRAIRPPHPAEFAGMSVPMRSFVRLLGTTVYLGPIYSIMRRTYTWDEFFWPFIHDLRPAREPTPEECASWLDRQVGELLKFEVLRPGWIHDQMRIRVRCWLRSL